MPQENYDSSPLFHIKMRMTNFVSMESAHGVATCVYEYRDHVRALIDTASDKVSAGASSLCDQLDDIAVALIHEDLLCQEALMIVESRLEAFVVDFLEPWVSENCGKECVVGGFSKNTIGKA
jgi:hypothetical protein